MIKKYQKLGIIERYDTEKIFNIYNILGKTN